MKYLRIGYRLFLVGIHFSVGLLISLTLLRQGEAKPPQEKERAIISWWMRRLARILGLRIRLIGELPDRPVLVVSNHISWLDIPALQSLLPVSFVSKLEVREWPLMGMMAARSGTLFIRRGGKNAANQAMEEIAFRLRRGHSMVVFPEATTTDGRAVRGFHPRLFGAAVHAEVYVQPVAIRYPHAQGVHPAAPFIDNEPFLHHGLRVLSEKFIQVEVTLSRQFISQGIDRRTLARQAHEAVRSIVECVPAKLQPPA